MLLGSCIVLLQEFYCLCLAQLKKRYFCFVFKEFSFSPRQHSFDQKHSKNSDTVKY